jgi:hypothetical protein
MSAQQHRAYTEHERCRGQHVCSPQVVQIDLPNHHLDITPAETPKHCLQPAAGSSAAVHSPAVGHAKKHGQAVSRWQPSLFGRMPMGVYSIGRIQISASKPHEGCISAHLSFIRSSGNCASFGRCLLCTTNTPSSGATQGLSGCVRRCCCCSCWMSCSSSGCHQPVGQTGQQQVARWNYTNILHLVQVQNSQASHTRCTRWAGDSLNSQGRLNPSL